MRANRLCMAAGGVMLLVLVFALRAERGASAPAQSPAHLAVVWTSGDPEVAHRMVLMYARAANKNKWFDSVELIVWGPSARLLAADKDIEAEVLAMKEEGITVRACVVCADSYGVVDRLRSIGLEVLGMGRPLTELLRSDAKVVTF